MRIRNISASLPISEVLLCLTERRGFESQLGRERYKVHGTPTVMLGDGTRLRLTIVFPVMRDRKIVGVDTLPCYGEGCPDETRRLFEQALKPV